MTHMPSTIYPSANRNILHTFQGLHGSFLDYKVPFSQRGTVESCQHIGLNEMEDILLMALSNTHLTEIPNSPTGNIRALV